MLGNGVDCKLVGLEVIVVFFILIDSCIIICRGRKRIDGKVWVDKILLVVLRCVVNFFMLWV